MNIDLNALDNTIAEVTQRLLASRAPAGYWPGYLSSSALATAVAAFALAKVNPRKYQPLIANALDWLAANANPDGGWGDTTLSKSNISTTLLVWSAFTVAPDPEKYAEAVTAAESWLTERAGALESAALAEAVNSKYGKDKTFSVPILTMCALAGRLNWKFVKPLPFEIAALPHKMFSRLNLRVVSYALPALIALGHAVFNFRPPANPITRLLRAATRAKTLRILEQIQPQNGGFLEAAPLTGFVTMTLAATGRKNSPVITKAVQFLANSVRPDGSWPIDTNLATWLTTLSVNALASASDFENILPAPNRTAIKNWLLSLQHLAEHPYTHAAPGGWAWTNLPGGVPDADDTAGALLALKNLHPDNPDAAHAAEKAVKWLIELQNKDGGFPTFCKGWSKLPFDRSAPDLTAHAVSALDAWFDSLSPDLQEQAKTAVTKSLDYLANAQKKDGSWIPLWFGNQDTPADENPLYGTAKVVSALANLSIRFRDVFLLLIPQAVDRLLSTQNPDGGWGGAKSVPSSIEETALAADAFATVLTASRTAKTATTKPNISESAVEAALSRAVSWLCQKTALGRQFPPAPIGLYFAKLWYFEELYPQIFTLAALKKTRNLYSIADTPGRQ